MMVPVRDTNFICTLETETEKQHVFVVKRYSIRNAKIRPYKERRCKINNNAISNGVQVLPSIFHTLGLTYNKCQSELT